MVRTAIAAVPVVRALGLAACSSSGGAAAEADAAGTAAAGVTNAICSAAAADKKVDLPSGFPADFPLPPKTTVYSVDDRGEGGIVVTGVTSTPFHTVLKSLQTQLPAHGYTPKDGETEPHDAESDWASSNYEGRWAIREITQCSGDTLVSVVARKSS